MGPRHASAAALPFVVATAMLFSGCFQSTTVIKVRGDGSGTIEQTTLMTGAALAQLRGFAAMGSDKSRPIDLFSPEEARRMAAAIGPDVTVVSTTPLKSDAGEGSTTVFAFPDVNQLQLHQQPPTPGGATIRTRGFSGDYSVRFALDHLPNGNAVLRITMPATRIPGIPRPTAPEGSGGTPASRIAPEQLAMIKQMFAGMRVTVAVEPEGRLVNTSSPFVDGSRVTLADIAIDELMNNDAFLARAQKFQTPEDAKAALKDIPGLKINLDPEITIEFTPAR